LKAKLWLFFTILLLSLSFAALVSAQTGQVYFKEDFNYASLDQMQAAGWTFTRPAGISVDSGAVILNGVGGDCAIHYNNHFQTGIFDWKVESKSMWLGQGHTTNGVYVSTEKHSYSFSADGYYDEFAFYRDNIKILRFGSYQETANQYFIMTMVREANTFSLYFNGELKNTYTENDTQQSAATGIALVSPWRGDAKYDYYQIGEPTAVFTSSNPTVSTDSFPMIPVLVGGGIAAAVVGGIVVYYFFIAGGGSASTGAGGGVGSAGAGSAGGTGSGGGSVIHDHPVSPLSGEANISPLSGENTNNSINSIDALHYPSSLPNLQTGQLEHNPSSGIHTGQTEHPEMDNLPSNIDTLHYPSSLPDLPTGQPAQPPVSPQAGSGQPGTNAITQQLQQNANPATSQTNPISASSPGTLNQVDPSTLQGNVQSAIDALRPPGSFPNLQTGQIEPGSVPSQPTPSELPQNSQSTLPSNIDNLQYPSNLPDLQKKVPTKTNQP
jgi:hypothetical protein